MDQPAYDNVITLLQSSELKLQCHLAGDFYNLNPYSRVCEYLLSKLFPAGSVYHRSPRKVHEVTPNAVHGIE